MTDLRKAAEMAVEMFDWLERRSMYQDLQMKETHEALRQALAEEALDRMVAENQKLGLYDEDNLQTAIEKGTKAWADVPDASAWVEELRGNDKPAVKSYCGGKPNYCTPQPEVCCGEYARCLKVCIPKERWFAQQKLNVDAVNISEERVHKSDKSIHEPTGWVKIDEVRQYFDSVGCGTIYKTAGEDRVPLYSAPQRQWVGLTEEDFYKKDDETVFVLGMKFAEARLKEKNNG